MKEINYKFRKSFYTAMKGMTDKQAGEYFRGICGYVFDGKPFETKDLYLKGVFLFVKKELDDSAQKSLNGRKGGIACAEKKAKQKMKQKELHGIYALDPDEIPLAEILGICIQRSCERTEKEGKVLHEEGKKQAG